jgi:DNA helicase-4
MYAFLIFITVGFIVAIRYFISIERKKYQNPLFECNQVLASEFLNLIQNKDDYITWVERDKIKNTYKSVADFFKNKTNYYKKSEIVGRFNTIYWSFDNYVSVFNQNYISAQKVKLKEYFADIENKELDEQQRTAVVTDEYSNLIIAGAGSGKTLTIVSKVKYLIEQKGIETGEILLLSFTKKTVEELNIRLSNLGLSVNATTFHKLGYDTIKAYSKDGQPVVANENTLTNVIKEFLQKDIYKDGNVLQAYIQYISCYMNIPEQFDKYDSLGEKIDTEKGIDFQTLKSKCEILNKVDKIKLDTIQGERVKSVEELIIANFLYLNGIEYEYERPYPYGDIMYRPDFYLTKYDIYIEHFGVNEDNRATWLTPYNEQKYLEEMQLKRDTHKVYNTKLIETYSYFNRDKILLNKLREFLEAENVEFKTIDVKEIYIKVGENDQNFGNEITKLIESFINLSKSRKLHQSELLKIFTDKSKNSNIFMLERQELFLKIVMPILKKYDDLLLEINQIDFNDMINKATELIKINKTHFNYKYIIIDEYQDISFSRYRLIKEIRDLCSAKLICVGDDWQSIYRFAGSDISLFNNFEKYVGKFEQLLIERTYRNSQSLIDVSSKFIQKNIKQIRKNPKSTKQILEDPMKFVYYKPEELEQIFISEIERLVNTYGEKSILVLGRHSFDINDLIKMTPNSRVKYIEYKDKLEISGFEHVDIKFLTVHKSKGTEADNVIVLNLSNNLLGFPNEMTDDPIISKLLNDDEDYRFAEERRLFYVALTRTKNEAVLLVPRDVSLFIKELLTDNNYLLSRVEGWLNTTNCPYCKTGKLIVRINSESNNQFLGCSHYPSCNQTFKNIEILNEKYLCSSCKSGFMIKRTGKYGDFLGCTNYSKCKNTININ